MGSTPIAPLSGPAVERPTTSPIVGLVQAAAAGDGAAFDSLVGLRLDRTYRTARAIFGNDHDARDAVQDVWLLVWRQLPTLRDVAAFDAWLDRIVVNTCRSALRRRGGIREIPMADTFDVRQPGPGPEQVAEREVVERAFERLDADKRAILVLHHVHHQPIDQIAAALGIPEGTAKWRLHAARNALARAMERER